MSTEQTEETIFCSNCRTVLPADADYCSACGTEQVVHDDVSDPAFLSVDERYCSDCGTVLDDIDSYCRDCGAPQPTGKATTNTGTGTSDATRIDSGERSGFHEAVSNAGSGMLFLLALVVLVPTSDYPASYAGAGLLFGLAGLLTLPAVKRHVSEHTSVTVTRAASISLAVGLGFAGLLLFGMNTP